MGIHKASDVLNSVELRGFDLPNKLFAPIAWGHVEKDGGLLVYNRHRPDDLERSGQLVFPGGHREGKESYLRTARRETFEETDVRTAPRDLGKFRGLHDNTVLKIRDKLVAAVQPDGRIWVYYTDSKKSYTGKLFDLLPLSEPSQKEDVSVNPRYEPAEKLIVPGEYDVTPAFGALLEMVGTYHGMDFLRKGDILLRDNDLRRYLRVATLL